MSVNRVTAQVPTAFGFRHQAHERRVATHARRPMTTIWRGASGASPEIKVCEYSDWIPGVAIVWAGNGEARANAPACVGSGTSVRPPIAGVGRLGMATVRCPRCWQEHPGEARFCLHCGAEPGNSCAACSAVLPPGAKFCLECGRAVTATPTPASYTPRHISEQIRA